MTYEKAKSILNGRSHKTIDNNTVLCHGTESYSIFFYGKKILTFRKNGNVKIEKFSSRSRVLKKRINNYLENVKIYQEDFEWFWSNGKKFRGGELF
jgi:hypothetical protein